MAPKVINTFVQVTMGDEDAGRPPHVAASTWSELHWSMKGKGKSGGKMNRLGKYFCLPPGSDMPEIEDDGEHGENTKVSWQTQNEVTKTLVVGHAMDDNKGFIREITTTG